MAKPTGPMYEHDCPYCHAKAGQWCKRPSGHQGPMVAPHKARRDIAQAKEYAITASATVDNKAEPLQDMTIPLRRHLDVQFGERGQADFNPMPRLAYLRDVKEGRALVPSPICNYDAAEAMAVVSALIAEMVQWIKEHGEGEQPTSPPVPAETAEQPDYTDADVRAYEEEFFLYLTAHPATAKKKIDKMIGAGILRYAHGQIRYPETKKAILRRLKAIKADPPREEATS